ncbi:hypothetical protein [Saccharothrix algeriensis]|uniref:Uncharacterized protein n=1 Tax=Saccharothrix algeriensis TaxID=173560 RepID=A0A8T8HZB9_9PSEU|nr:hypothetical protein [Saccharothrix algeriensis]MBM7809616.1 hypothetical protein [Saccharothrix algeriensis]QTR03925.1 hypothetical protein J7S33_02540 [Saccharothrix algeriensis]
MPWGDWRPVARGAWQVVGGPWDGLLVVDRRAATPRWTAVADVLLYPVSLAAMRSGTGSPTAV